MEWLDGVADELGVARLTPVEVEQLLTLARAVAHGTERMNAPLATYLVGRATGTGTGTGMDLGAARSIVETLAVSQGGS